jgi:hypothetical protein
VSQCFREYPSQQDGTQHCNNKHAKVEVLNNPGTSVPMKLEPTKRQIHIRMWAGGYPTISHEILSHKKKNHHYHEGQSVLKHCHTEA